MTDALVSADITQKSGPTVAIALGGVWLVNRIDLGDVKLPALAWQSGASVQR